MADSVGFGPGITADGTIDALLRPRLNGRKIYNASVVGYDSFDYKNAGLAIVRDKPEIKDVIIIFCLNDLSGLSAREIKAQGAHIIAGIYFLLFTPMRLLGNLIGRDKLQLKKPQKDTYWLDISLPEDPKEYERQF